MGKRDSIGLFYSVNEGWIGGTYYIQNIVSALNLLEDNKKPNIDIYTQKRKDFDDLKVKTNYPYLYYVNTDSKWRFFVHAIFKHLCLRKLANNVTCIKKRDIFVFPSLQKLPYHKELAWIPDFQSERLPELFLKEDADARRASYLAILERGTPIVFSSYDSLNDCKFFFPQYSVKTYVMHFAVTLPDILNNNFLEVARRHHIGFKHYYFCGNQFWAHKNHLYLFKEFKKLLEAGHDINLICTGTLEDYRNPLYIEQIRVLLEDTLLKSHVMLLGFISRVDMLVLMKHSIAVIQPSLFEGWSTVVEDAKALNKFVFLSDLPVHREQMTSNVCFFDPRKETDLADKLSTTKPYVIPMDYNKNRKEFAAKFLSIIDDVKNRVMLRRA